MEVEILTGEDAPEIKQGAPIKYPFEKMKIGDHFVWKCNKDEDPQDRRKSIITTATQRGYKVTCRTEGTLIKVWLVEGLDV